MKKVKLLIIAAIGLFVIDVCCTAFISKIRKEEPKESTKTPKEEPKESSMLEPVVDNTVYVILNNDDEYYKEDEEKKEEKTEEVKLSHEWKVPPVPWSLTHYMDSAEWNIDTICVASGKAYYYAYDTYGRTLAIYSMNELLCEDPTLKWLPIHSDSRTKFHICTSFRSMTVDFSNRNDIKKLKRIIPHYSGICHFRRDYFATKGNVVLYHFEVDYPKDSTAYCNRIRKWLVQKVNKPLDIDKVIPEYQKKYKGDIGNIQAIGRFASNRYFEIKKQKYGENVRNYPCGLDKSLSLRLISSNGKYVSYQKHTYEYNDGAHGYATEFVVSFDPQANEEITWDYLFVPNCEKDVLTIFYRIVQEDPRYQQWEDVSSIDVMKKNFENNGDDSFHKGKILPNPGLTDTGVLFSFQPYEISGHAAGSFHFIIPYKDLKPYLTQKAKKLLNL